MLTEGQDILEGRFQIVKKIGSGAFGEIYKGKYESISQFIHRRPALYTEQIGVSCRHGPSLIFFYEVKKTHSAWLSVVSTYKSQDLIIDSN